MQQMLSILVAILPCLAIAYGFYRLGRHRPKPLTLLLLSLLLGVVVTYPAHFIEKWAFDQGWDRGDHLGLLLLTAFITVAFNEELFKYAALRGVPYRHASFGSELDGILYTVIIGMGFAASENVLYAFRESISTVLGRALTAVPAHAIFAVFMGYFIGKAKQAVPSQRWRLHAKGILIAVALHGIYDFFIIQDFSEPLLLGAPISLIVMGFFAYRLIIRSLTKVPTEPDAPELRPEHDEQADTIQDDDPFEYMKWKE